MTRIRVLLADDHNLVRAGIRALLKEMPGIEVVAEANNGREAIELAATHQPHIVLMDIMMPEMNGLDATARLTAKVPDVRVIILSMNATEEYVLQALQAGACGYLLKDVPTAELQQAIHAVAHGDKFLSSAISKQVIAGVKPRNPSETSPPERLSLRQREVLQLIAEGCSTKEIALKLGIGAKTVETHRALLMKALGIYEVAGLVRYAIRQGIVSI